MLKLSVSFRCSNNDKRVASKLSKMSYVACLARNTYRQGPSLRYGKREDK